MALYGWRVIIGNLPVNWSETNHVLMALISSSLLITLLALLIKPEPFAVHVDYRSSCVTCYRLSCSWRLILPLYQLRCKLTEQSSHKGLTHFLVVSGPQGQAWAMQESNGWPLARLELLQELLIFDASR